MGLLKRCAQSGGIYWLPDIDVQPMTVLLQHLRILHLGFYMDLRTQNKYNVNLCKCEKC